MTMLDKLVIPDPDPIPLPAPFWLLKVLLLLTFFLHVVPMNFLLGGGFITAVSDFLGRKRNDQNYLSLANSMGQMLPVIVAATITLGIAPLLFVQVLYGQFFYTSSVLMAVPWISVILILIIAYYGLYYYAFRWQQLQGKRLAVIWISALLFMLISFIYTNNLVLMLTPQKWMEMYQTSKLGMHLNLSDPTVIPRWLHFLVASFAVAGLLVVIHGLIRMKSDASYGRFAVKYGAGWFIIATVAQFAVGVWFLVSLPNDVMMLFLGANGLATTLLVVGIFFALLGIVLLLLATVAQKPKVPAIFGMASIIVTIISMIIMRDIVRSAYLAKTGVNVASYPVSLPVSIFVLFVLFLVIAVGLVLVMLIRLRRGARVSQPA